MNLIKTKAGIGACAAVLCMAGTAMGGLSLPSGFDVTVNSGNSTWSLASNPDAVTSVHETENGYAIMFNFSNDWMSVSTDEPMEISNSFGDGGETFRFINSSFTITNTEATTESFTVDAVLDGLAPLPAGSVITGSHTGTVADNPQLNLGATVSTTDGFPLYEAFIDGASVRTLFDDPFSESADPAQTKSYPEQGFIQEPSIALVDAMSITNKFDLTAGDSVTMQSTFFVEVPAPGSAALLLAASGVAFRRRRN